MKAALFALAGLSTVVLAQPHRRHHHQRRDVVTDVDTTTAVQDVMIYVDEEGKPTATSTLGSLSTSSAVAADEKFQGHHRTYAPVAYSSSSSSSTSVPSPSTTSVYIAPTPSSSTSVYVAPTTSSTTEKAPTTTSVTKTPTTTEAPYTTKAPTTTEVPTTTEAPTTTETPTTTEVPTSYSTASSTTSAQASTYSSSSSSSGSGLGITYSPYKADGTCKTSDEVMTDFDQIVGYSTVRTYGTDCDQVANVLAAAQPKGMKLFAGIFDIDDITSELSLISSAANGDWSSFDTIAIGNELVNSGTKSVAEVAAAVALAKTQLALIGYTGSIVTVDTFVAIIANPAMCDIGDYVAANCHAFFDGGVTAANAGQFVVDQTQRVSAACGGKKTIITESGWPSQGDANKDAVPSEANQESAISSLKSSFSSGIYLFNAYNDMWKKDNSATFGAEKYWGMYGMSAAN